MNSFLLSSFIVRGRDIRMQTRSRGDVSWMIVSRVMIRLKTKFVELLLWVPDQLTQWSRRSISFGRGIDGRVAATQISVRFCDGDSSKLKNPDQSKW